MRWGAPNKSCPTFLGTYTFSPPVISVFFLCFNLGSEPASLCMSLGPLREEMMDEIDRLKTFEPPEKSDDNKVNVKLFLEEDIRFLELDPDVSYEELIIAVGKVFIESYVIKFEVGSGNVTA